MKIFFQKMFKPIVSLHLPLHCAQDQTCQLRAITKDKWSHNITILKDARVAIFFSIICIIVRRKNEYQFANEEIV